MNIVTVEDQYGAKGVATVAFISDSNSIGGDSNNDNSISIKPVEKEMAANVQGSVMFEVTENNPDRKSETISYKWSVSDSVLGELIQSTGRQVVYMNHINLTGFNIITVENQYKVKAIATVNQK